MSLPPFNTPAPDCRCAWNGGSRARPDWLLTLLAVDTAGYHELLRRAGLPRAELLHMGASAVGLSVPAQWTPREEAARVLGRAAWDARYGEQGQVFQSSDEYEVRALGEQVIAERFHA